jgi:hypothetical protein
MVFEVLLPGLRSDFLAELLKYFLEILAGSQSFETAAEKLWGRLWTVPFYSWGLCGSKGIGLREIDPSLKVDVDGKIILVILFVFVIYTSCHPPAHSYCWVA